MKRFFAIFLCFVLLLTGCGGGEAPADTTEETTVGTEATEGTGSSTLPTVTDPSGEATEPSAPTDSTEPTQPTEPSAPTEPSEPTDPTAPTNPTQPPYQEPDPEPDDGITDIGPEEPEFDEQALYEQLFDLNNKVSIHVDMSDEELAKLQADYVKYKDMGSKSPIYRRADVTIRINSDVYRIRDVGVRMKGNTSRASFYKPENGGIYRAIHLKLDFQETFDDEEYYGADAVQWADKDARKARKNRTFATLEKLELRWNKCYDSTYLRELYAYELYRSEGVLAPLVNLCSMDFSDVHMGIYTINEPVDEVFLEKRLPADALGGDLYKCGWTWEGASFKNTNSIGIENEDNCEFYCYDLKTNKKTSQHEALKNLITSINSPTITKEKFAELVDVDNFISYAAASYFLGNPDDLRNNYNNYYLYFRADNGKALLIPYDYDRCLGVTVEYNPSGHAMTVDNPFSDRREGAQNGPQEQDIPLFYLTVVKGGWYVKQYADALTKVSKNTLLTKETFKSYYTRAQRLYANDVRPSRTLKNMDGRNPAFDLYRTSGAHEGNNMSFNDYIDAKMASFQGYMKNVNQYLNYQRPTPVTHYIRGDFNGWSNDDKYAMTLKDGLYTFTLTSRRSCSFKVYDNVNSKWYGTEYLPEGWELDYETDDHANFDMKAGTYYITFDPATEIVTVTKQ